MVQLFGFRAYMFESGLDRIRDSFRASITTMQNHSRDANDLLLDYINSGVDDSEYDDEGALIKSTRHELQHAALETTLALSVVQEAFITSAFHYWERSARAWTGLHKPTFEALTKEVRKADISVSDELSAVNTLNNLIKHNNPDRALDLVKTWPDVFITLPYSTLRRELTWRLGINNATVERVFSIVKASGPV